MKPLNPVQKGTPVNDPRPLNEVIDRVNWLVSAPSGPGLARACDGNLYSLVEEPRREPPRQSNARENLFLGQIVQYEEPNQFKRDGRQVAWQYQVLAVRLQSAVEGGPDAVFDAVPDVEPVVAWNLTEYINMHADVYGNGINHWNLINNFSGMRLRPAPVGTLVFVMRLAANDGVQYWFQYENAVDGTC